MRRLWVLLAICLTCVPGVGLPQPQGRFVVEPRPELASDLGSLRTLLDRTQIDLASMSEVTSGMAPSAIASEIGAVIGFDAYRGLLRGPGGTIASQAGNAWDHAALLGRILEGHGHEIRFARAQLPEALARGLLASTGPRAQRLPSKDVEALRAGFSELSTSHGLALPDSFYLALGENVDPAPRPADIARSAERAVAALGVAMPDGSPLQLRALEEAQDYVWVQHKQPDGRWESLHTLLPGDTRLSPNALYERLPEAAAHRIALELELETQAEGQTSLTPLIPRTDIFRGDAGQVAVRLMLVEDHILRNGTAAGPETEPHLVPLLNGSMAEGTRAFSASGTTEDARILLSSGVPAAAGRIGGAFEGLSGGLGGLGSTIGSSPPTASGQPTITALQVTLLHWHPFAEAPRRLTRRLSDKSIDTNGTVNAADAAAVALGDLQGIWDVYVVAGTQSSALLLDSSLAFGMRLFGENGAPPAPFDPALAFGTYMNAALADGAARTFRAAPMIAIEGLERGTDNDAALWLDILFSDLRAFANGGAPAPRAALAAGMAQTLLEPIYLGVAADVFGSGTVQSAWAALTESPPLTRVDTLAMARTATGSGFSAQALQRDLDAGYLIAIGSGPQSAWWRIDPLTGAATGVNARGRGGSETIEKIIINAYYSLKIANEAIEVWDVVLDVLACREAGGSIYDSLVIVGYSPLKYLLGKGLGKGVSKAWSKIATKQDEIAWASVWEFDILKTLIATGGTGLILFDKEPSDKVWDAICKE